MSSRLALLTVLALLLAGVAVALLNLRPIGAGAATARSDEQQLEEMPLAPVVMRPVEEALPRTRVVRDGSPAESSVRSEPEELWLPVRIAARNGSHAAAKPVAGVEVAVWMGPPSPDMLVLATGTTDAEGVCELEVPWSAAEAARSNGNWIHARPIGSGWLERVGNRPIPEALESVEIHLVARAGFTVRGHLLGEHERPVRGKVRARGFTDLGAPATGYGIVRSTGWFEAHVEHAGTYDLIGTAHSLRGATTIAEVNVATGVVRGVQIDASHLPQDLTLQLRGAGVVRGRVQTARGQPVAGIGLFLNSTLIDSAEGNEYEDHRQLLAEGQGGFSAAVRTGTDGQFEVRGLLEGTFDVTVGQPPMRLNQAPIPSDGNPIVLVFDHTHMVVRLVDEHDAPWLGELNSRSFWLNAFSDEWTDAPLIIVVPTSDSLASANWDKFDLNGLPRGRLVGDACKSFEVQPGNEYLVGLVGGPGAWNPKRVRIPERGGRVDVTLRIGEQTGLGTLSLTLVDPAGLITNNITVRIEDPQTGLPLIARSSFDREPWPLELQLPAGSYRLAVEGHPDIDHSHGVLLAYSSHGRFEAELSIAAGGVTAMEAHLPAGARIDLELEGKTEASDTQAVVERWSDYLQGDLDYWGGRAQIRLLSEKRWPRPVSFKIESSGSGDVLSHLSPNLPIGTRQTSELLPAGRYTLEARMPGGRVASVPVTLVDGETLGVTLEL